MTTETCVSCPKPYVGPGGTKPASDWLQLVTMITSPSSERVIRITGHQCPPCFHAFLAERKP